MSNDVGVSRLWNTPRWDRMESTRIRTRLSQLVLLQPPKKCLQNSTHVHAGLECRDSFNQSRLSSKIILSTFVGSVFFLFGNRGGEILFLGRWRFHPCRWCRGSTDDDSGSWAGEAGGMIAVSLLVLLRNFVDDIAWLCHVLFEVYLFWEVLGWFYGVFVIQVSLLFLVEIL